MGFIFTSLSHLEVWQNTIQVLIRICVSQTIVLSRAQIKLLPIPIADFFNVFKMLLFLIKMLAMFPDLKMFPSAVATCTDCCQPETLTWAYWGSDTEVWLTAYMTGGISSKSLSYFSHHCQGWSHHITDYVMMLWKFPSQVWFIALQ